MLWNGLINKITLLEVGHWKQGEAGDFGGEAAGLVGGEQTGKGKTEEGREAAAGVEERSGGCDPESGSDGTGATCGYQEPQPLPKVLFHQPRPCLVLPAHLYVFT